MCDSSRRHFLKTAAATAALFAPAAGRLARADVLGEDAARLQPFPIGAVRLSPGIFRTQADINERYLDSLSTDRLLHTFRLTAGITSSATPYRGWEDPTCELRGHFAGGHYLSAVALSSNSDLRSKGDALVGGLAQCQKKLGTGYLSAYPADLFQHLVEGKPVWAPFYTYHKIMAGLLDMYVLTGNTDALHVAEGMAGWLDDYFQGISDTQRQRMLRTEYGGINEVLVNLAAITKKQRYIDSAHRFEQPGILDPLAERRDELQGLHANTNVPKIIGAARMYEVTGDRRYRQIAEYFLEEVVTARNYAIGNTSLDEHWRTAPGQLKGTLGWKNAECCVAYNLMKLQRLVFGWTGDPRWMDQYERALFNCRLGTQNDQGLKQYFFPLAAGYWRAYNSAEESFWCCTGTGAEEFAKFYDTVFFHRGPDVFVNQFLAATFDWKDEAFALEQVTDFPHEQATTLKVKSSRPGVRTIHVRIPAWVAAVPQVKINGRPADISADPGSYLAVRREWKQGDTLSITLPMQLREQRLPGDDSSVALLYGPLVLAADMGSAPNQESARIIHSGETSPKSIPAAAPLPKASTQNAADSIRVESTSDLRFKATAAGANYDVMPMYQVRDQRYSVYWQTADAKA